MAITVNLRYSGKNGAALMGPTRKNMTVMELVERYLATRTGVKPGTRANDKYEKNILANMVTQKMFRVV